MALVQLGAIAAQAGEIVDFSGLSVIPQDVVIRIPSLPDSEVRPVGFCVFGYRDDFGAGLERFWIDSVPLLARVTYAKNPDRNDIAHYLPLSLGYLAPFDVQLWYYA